MADPLSALEGRVPVLSRTQGEDAQSRGVRQLWSDLFRSSGGAELEALRQRAARGQVPIGERPTLRWLHWKLFLSQHLSSTPSSWSAVLDKDRSHYAAIRRDLLRAPDGNFPPDLGLDDDEQAITAATAAAHAGPRGNAYAAPAAATAAAASSSAARPSPSSGSTSRSQVIGDLSVNNPLSLDDSNPWKTHYASLETRQTIAQDVERTFPDMDLFRRPKVQRGLTNALFVWCAQNEDVGYRQGMHELMAVLWIVRQRDAVRSATSSAEQGTAAREDLVKTVLDERWIEHDVYTLFCALMHNAKSWFEWRTAEGAAPPAIPRTVSRGSFGGTAAAAKAATPAAAPTPIVAKCERIRELLHTTDPSLAQHLDSLSIEPQLFALRWIRLIFTREFPLEDALKLWDALFASDPSLALIDHVCVAMLMRVRNELLAADYSAALQTLLRYPIDPNNPEGGNDTELLVEQALYLRNNGCTPVSGVAVVFQNRDRLGIPPSFPDAGTDSPEARAGDTRNGPLGSPTRLRDPGTPVYQARVSPKFATVGRSPSSSNPAATWQRPAASRLSGVPQLQQRVAEDPLSASAGPSGGALPQSPSRSFGIVSSAYIPEGISDFARGLYERSDSLGINRALSSTMVNVQRTVAAAAAGVAASGSGPGATGNGGFPSSFIDSRTPAVSNASFTQAPLPTSKSFQPDVPRRNASATAGRAAAAQASVAAPRSDASEIAAKLEGLTTTNKAVGAALSACIDVLEASWLSQRESSLGEAHPTDAREDIDQNEVDTLMSFTALKHIRDVLKGTAKEFDPATLPPKRSPVAAASSKGRPNPPGHAADSQERHLSNASLTSPSSPPAASDSRAGRVAASPKVDPFARIDKAEVTSVASQELPPKHPTLPMTLPEYSRYGRQMILPDFGLDGQLRLRQSKVLVVGAGGLGCPAIQYLAAAGVGQISIVDHDSVEASNLARQILHSDAMIGVNKAESAARAARVINPFIRLQPHPVGFSSDNARTLIAGHDLVLDCTDNPLTRYLISDAAVLEGVQVVSGAAQGYDGQLVVLHKKTRAEFLPASARPAGGAAGTVVRGPCYRCLFPVAPKPEDVTDCEDGGVLGGITGLVGTLQALEAVKLLAGLGEETPPIMTLASPMSGTPFRTVKLRPRRSATCRSCGDAEQVGREEMITDLTKEDYVSFCHLARPDLARKEGQSKTEQRVTVQQLRSGAERPLIVDVRPPVEFGITRLEGSINIPYPTLRKDPNGALATIRSHLTPSSSGGRRVTLVCKRGNDSLLAMQHLATAQATDLVDQEGRHVTATQQRQEEEEEVVGLNDPLSAHSTTSRQRRPRGLTTTPPPPLVEFTDLLGGLRAYAREDGKFPMY